MTAIIVVSILAFIAFFLIVGAIGYLKQIKVGPLVEIVKVQRDLILKIEELADVERELSNPLAYQILSEIRDARKKENSK